MNAFVQFWNTIVQTNTFNFAIMAILLGVILKKIKIMQILENACKNVVDSIEKSKAEKASAYEKLDAAKDLIKNLDNEIETQLNEAREQGEVLSSNIANDTENRIAQITGNIERAIQSEEKTISTRLSRKTATAAVTTAENHIREILKNSPDMHNKYIRESINELDRIQL